MSIGKILFIIFIISLGGLGLYGVYYALSRWDVADSLRVGIASLKASWEGGVKLDIELEIQNPTDTTLKLDKIDLVASYKGKPLGNTLPGRLDAVIAPNAVTKVNIPYVVPVTALISGILPLSFDLILKIKNLASGGDWKSLLKGFVLDFEGSVQTGTLTAPFAFTYDLGA